MAEKKPKIMLTYPNFRWANWESRSAWHLYPYNVGILAATIRDDYTVKFVDANLENLTEEEFSRRLSIEKPQVLGISVLANQYGQAGLITAKIAKETSPEIVTVMGGVYAISLPEKVIADKNIDFVVNGEGEYVFKKLCDFVSKKGSLPTKGILYKKDGEIINTGREDFIQNLDDIPYPAYDIIDFKPYFMKGQREEAGEIGRPRAYPYANIMTSRGCPIGCCFCAVESIMGKKPRFRSVENIMGEIDLLVKNYGIKFLHISDDNLLVDKERAKNLFRAIADRHYDLSWDAPALAVFMLDEEMIDLMKKSRCEFVDIAIESGCERVLKQIIHKPLNLEYSKKMIEKLKEYDIDIAANFVIGFPDETWDEIRQSIKFAEEIDVDWVKFNIATPLPNTRLYKEAQEKKCIVPGFSFDNPSIFANRGWIETKEFSPADLMVLRAYEWDRINFATPKKREKIANMMGITQEKLSQIRKETLQNVIKSLSEIPSN